MDLTKLYQKQFSLSEWLEQIGFEKTEAFRKEDNEKRKALEKLSTIIDLPFDKPAEFTAENIANNSEKFQTFLSEHGNELCALRLIPSKEGLEKLRMRGHTVKDTLKWFFEQKIDYTKYRADVVPHSEVSTWSTTFIVNKNGIFGEIISGGHHQLSQGFYENKPIFFKFDFQNWELSVDDKNILEYLKSIMAKIFVPNIEKQNLIKEKLTADFYNNYLAGYFETADSEQFGLWFIDWNKILGKMYEDYIPTIISKDEKEEKNMLIGQPVYPGILTGQAKITTDPKEEIETNEILICQMTATEYLPLMKKCAAILTEEGGILSHAAIIARELKKPCIVGVKNILSKIKNGDLLEIDAKKGIIKIIK